MTTLQDLFTASSLDVIVPDTTIELPTAEVDADEWLARLKTPTVERKLAFFDEKLDYYLTIQVKYPDATESPPAIILAFLSHLQISFDASYISSMPAPSQYQEYPNRMSTPPIRSASLLPKSRHPPSIFPPATPHPIPSTAESDRRYVRSEGTSLTAGVWGEDRSEGFQLLRSEANNSWVAIYKLVVGVAFVRMNFSDPLLCLTVSMTLREKPAPLTGPRQRLAELIDIAGGLPLDPSTPITPMRNKSGQEEDDELAGLEEINLLGGLLSAPTFRSEDIAMPSTRLGPSTRREAFSLLTHDPEVPSPSTPTPTLRNSLLPTLRKSFRKTLKTVSGFRVRMRTVFVPYVLFPEQHVDGKTISSDAESDEKEEEWDRERREAGNDESTVVLCVEVENYGESKMGFTVESVDVHISGEGAKTTLIRWGENPSSEVFPLRIASMEQYNLLYAVAFLGSPEAEATRKQSDMQRAVAINIHGRPHDVQEDGDLYPTQTFSSRWNCILDLSANINKELVDVPTTAGGNKEALPTPASPFPTAGPSTVKTTAQEEPKSSSVVAGSKRHTIGGSPSLRSSIKAPVNYRSSTSMLNPAFQQREREPLQTSALNYGSGGFIPPSITLQNSYARPPTTYGQSATSPPPVAPIGFDDEGLYSPPPLTPAYPAFPNSPSMPQTPVSQVPVAGTQSTVGPSVEIRRGGGVRVLGGNANEAETQERGDGQSVVVSVGLLPIHVPGRKKGSEEIYPNDKFTLDIFVFNQSSWMRRFEISYPDGRTWRKRVGGSAGAGIMPLENRIRVGPLRPSTCQSVRMDFMALAPGVHPVDILTLTDIESGYSVNLRSVMDIVVHEPPDE